MVKIKTRKIIRIIRRATKDIAVWPPVIAWVVGWETWRKKAKKRAKTATKILQKTNFRINRKLILLKGIRLLSLYLILYFKSLCQKKFSDRAPDEFLPSKLDL
jgi:hypothetical protein